jgi:hypothetical protein
MYSRSSLVVKGKVIPLHATEALGWEEVLLLLNLNLGTRWSEWSASRSAALYPRGKDPRYPLYRRLGGPQSRSGHRYCLCRDRTPVVQSVVRHYTDWVTPAHFFTNSWRKNVIVTSCGLLGRNQCFGRTYNLHLKGGSLRFRIFDRITDKTPISVADTTADVPSEKWTGYLNNASHSRQAERTSLIQSVP